MKSKRILSVLLPLLSSVNVGLTSPVAISLPRHSKPELLGDTSWVPLQYIGPIHPGGSDITLNGTAQELHSQILHLNPDFQISDFAEPEPEEPSTTTTPHLRARNPLAPWCNPPGIGTTSGYATLSNINYLRDLPGRCYVAEGPRTCARIACWHGAAVFVCNDNTLPIRPSCQYLSQYVDQIYSTCFRFLIERDWYASGQQFDTDNYNVVVTAQDC